MASSTNVHTRRRVLLVEDHAVMRRSITRLLEPEADVCAVADGKSALSRLSLGSFELVLVDFRLPDTDGAKLLRQLRNVDARPLRVVMSGALIPGQAQLLRDGLVHAVLLKPVPLAAWLDLFARVTPAGGPIALMARESRWSW